MGVLSKALNAVGLVLLAHSIYSAHEHTVLLTSVEPPSSPSSTTNHALPTDITIELLFSLVLLSVGIVLSAPGLRPIQWSQWAGTLEKKGFVGEEGSKEEERIRDPFRWLEARVGFWDVRKAREDVVEWVKGVKN